MKTKQVKKQREIRVDISDLPIGKLNGFVADYPRANIEINPNPIEIKQVFLTARV